MKERVQSFFLDDLAGLQDSKFLKHDYRKKQLSRPSSLEMLSPSLVLLKMKSSDFSSNKKTYDLLLDFPDMIEMSYESQVSLKEVVDLVLDAGDVKLACSCPAFQYWGYAYISTRLDASFLDTDYVQPGLKRAGDISPVERNPDQKGVWCKHLGRMYDWFKSGGGASVLRKTVEKTLSQYVDSLDDVVSEDVFKASRRRIR